MIWCCCVLLVICRTLYGCCTPSRWEGKQKTKVVSLKDGSLEETNSVVNVSFDAVSKKLHFEYGYDNASLNQEILQDYNTGKMYIVQNSKCSVHSVGEFPGHCTRVNDTKILSTYLGTGITKINIDVFRMVYDNREVEFTVERDGCIPVSTLERNHQSVSVTSVNYIDFTIGIKNDNTFKIPQECQGSLI